MPGVTESLGRSLKQAHERQIRRDGFAHSLHTHIATLLNESSVSATLEALFALRDNSLLPTHARGHDRVKAARPDFQFDIVRGPCQRRATGDCKRSEAYRRHIGAHIDDGEFA